MSSIVSIDIDGHPIDTCGSTVIVYDTRLDKQDIEDVDIESAGGSAQGIPTVIKPDDLRFEDWWTIQHWFFTRQTNSNPGEKVVIIQSQTGTPICMFSGANVSWDIPVNLPKTTEIIIDGRYVYVHRGNFAVIDTALMVSDP
jgi:hypothetical protein